MLLECWRFNIQKNKDRIQYPLFLKEIVNFDLVFLADTHIGPDAKIGHLLNFIPYVKKITKTNQRYFGGLAILCKENIKNHVKILPNSNPDYQSVKLEKSFFGFQKKLFICRLLLSFSVIIYSKSTN